MDYFLCFTLQSQEIGAVSDLMMRRRQHGAVLIPSPELFEREVLQREEWKRQLDIDGFASFVDVLFQVGFEKVLNQRPSKVQRFRKKRAGAKRKRKMPEGKNFELTAEKNQERNSA